MDRVCCWGMLIASLVVNAGLERCREGKEALGKVVSREV